MPELTSLPEHINNDSKVNDKTGKAEELLPNLQGEIAKRTKFYKMYHPDIMEKAPYSNLDRDLDQHFQCLNDNN